KYPTVNYSELVLLLRKASLDGELTFYIINNKTHLDRWDFSGAFGFAISVVTTIVFLTPQTDPEKKCFVLFVFLNFRPGTVNLGAYRDCVYSFGNLAPHTMEGKVLCVIYALIGIPLMLLLLAGIGEKLMLLFKRIKRLNICSTQPQ
ncbi:hypothetical protein BaRGS_00003184, partial [Batillaria attramentaria]